jgi:AraC-like DNA-binding protein
VTGYNRAVQQHERRLKQHQFNSPAGPWRLWTWAAAPDLDPAVACLWATEAQTVAFREKVVPRETVELMINFGGRQTVHRVERPSDPQHFRRAWVSGLQSACLDIESPSAAQLMAASLRPAHAGALLGVSGAEIAGSVIPLDDLIARAASELADRLEESPSIVGRFLLFEDFLRERLRRGRKPTPLTCRAVQRIAESGGAIASRALQEELGCSGRYLEKQMAEQVGLTPKRLSRLIRFSRVIDRVRTETDVDWGRIAHACGFYDQSHFNNEFRAFTGTTPSGFLALRDSSTQAMILE